MQTLQQLQLGELKGITKFKLNCGLTEFPKEIFTLSDTLELLDLSGNKLSALPDDFYKLTNLKILFLSDNSFTAFPDVLGKCHQLDIIGFKANQIASFREESLPSNTRWLILTNNQLTEIPKSIGKCTRMQKLMLAGNKLTSLPIELKECKQLGLLRISANNLSFLPDWLLTMPRLSWLAFAGNPFCTSNDTSNTGLATINWKELSIQHQLGEGASGIIWKANWQEESEVAVKLFKGAITSDGLPDDEMNASILAEDHPNLVTVLGKIDEHPEDKKGLVFSLIPHHYTNLGSPPSFETCTRDVFSNDTSFTTKATLTIAKGIASVAAQLHEKGIMHGDLYAHNILIDENAHPLFGDFGAASLYDKEDKAMASLLERIEVSAFGCLLDDLLTYTKEKYNNQNILKYLIQLKEDCMQNDVSNRPSFISIYEILESFTM